MRFERPFCSSAARSGGGAVPERESIPEKYRWDLEAIYPSSEDWERAYSGLLPKVDALTRHAGGLGSSSEALLSFLKEQEAVSLELGKLYVYANMKSHEDLRIASRQEAAARVEGLMTRFAAACAFFRPEVLEIPEERLRSWLAGDEGLKLYDFYLSELLRERPHVLSHAEEELLARSRDLGGVAERAFSLLTDADMKFPTIRDEDGSEVELTEERAYKLSRSRDRGVRRASFEGIHSTYGSFRNSIGALYSGSVKGDIFYSRARRHPDSLSAALFSDNVPATVYDNVVDSANRFAPLMHRCVELRQRVLGLDELHYYDLNVPMSEEPVSEVSFEDACEMVAEALEPLGEDYVRTLRRGFEERWLDVYENQGKRKGAYSWGSFGTRPYVLLNYNGTLRDVFTLAHEMGHSLHSHYSHEHQPQVYADYAILLAEVASTTNEALLLEYLLRKSRSDAERKWLLAFSYDMVRTTFFRQAMFAEFERRTHAHVEADGALTPEWLCNFWGELNGKYYGPALVLDEPLKMEWARIPHFYSAFYVYKYVTGFTAAGAFASAILSEGEPARERYLTFLRSGSCDFPLSILERAGVDLTSPEPFERTMEVFKRRLDEWGE
ncbi:MAG: oligoendopeptidase F [Fretibacterium sp.]|nr:oligoendopeptidase F [Fretibacterium sp.]